MTMDERIEAAARTTGWYDALSEQEKADTRDRIGVMFAAALPELSGDKPTHWLAPMLMTSEMKEAARRLERDARQGYFLRSSAWEAMRDAYLGKGDGK